MFNKKIEIFSLVLVSLFSLTSFATGALDNIVISDGSATKKIFKTKNKSFKVNIESFSIKKDMKRSLVGYDAEDWNGGYNLQWMLTEGREGLIKNFQAAGVRVFRWAEMYRYSWRGELETRKMKAAYIGAKYPNNPQKVKNVLKTKRHDYFKPELLWDFCKEQNILICSMFPGQVFYDHETKKGIYFVNKPQYYQKVANESAAYVRWLKKKDYLSHTTVWEIGNEVYAKGWTPKEFAAYVVILAKEVRLVQPDIKMGIPVFLCEKDDPDFKQILKRINNQRGEVSKEWLTYEKHMRWSGEMILALGKNASLLSHGVQHTYGGGRKYNCNYKGVNSHVTLTKAYANSKHWRQINTEWRDRSRENLWCHRNYRVSALWKAKFVMLLMAHPMLDYSFTHSLTGWSGGLFWSDGKKWGRNRTKEDRKRYLLDTNNPNGKPRYALGPFAPVAKMCNDLITTHPVMVARGSGDGLLSSAIYYESMYKNLMSGGHTVDSHDVDFLAGIDRKKTSLSLLVVNTYDKSINLELSLPVKANIQAASFEELTCKKNSLDEIYMPGEDPFWFVNRHDNQGKNTLTVRPNSVTRITLPITR